MANSTNKLPIGAIAVVVVVVILAAILLLSRQSPTPTYTTTISTQPNLTTVTVATVYTTIVTNLTKAVGSNFATCVNYNSTIPNPYYQITGSCNWRGGLLNLTVYGGGFSNATVTLIQLNATAAPFNASATSGTCTTKSGVFYTPPGNYRVTFTTGATSPTSKCGSATVVITR